MNPEPFGFEKAYGFQEGQIVPAGAFPVGEYTLEAGAEFDGAVQFETAIDSYIDASDSTTCTMDKHLRAEGGLTGRLVPSPKT